MPNHKLSIAVTCICTCVLAFITSCNSNSPQGVDRIVNSGSYNVSVYAWACFGDDTTILNISKDGNVQKAAFTFAGDTEKGGYTKTTGQVTWNADKEKLLRQFFAAGLVKKDKQTCTAEAVYTLYSGNDTVTFTDDACEFDKRFEELMQ